MTNLTDEQWQLLCPVLETARTPKKGGRPRSYPFREIVNGILYITKTGCQCRGVAIFAKAFMGIPAQQAAKATRPLMPAAAPAVLLHSLDTQQGVSNIFLAMTRRDVGKACIFTTQKALRENTCTIASGDYSTPVSQRRMLPTDFAPWSSVYGYFRTWKLSGVW
ncbi:MAG: transposase, partial [Methylobacter sp.]|nr:transposase [Methylobacter sp.]